MFIADSASPPKPTKCSTLYARVQDGKPLGQNDFVISADEKTSIQARCRAIPRSRPGAPAPWRVDHTYRRRGALAYLAAYDVGRAEVSGRCEDRHRPVHRTGHPGHDPGALRLRGPGVLDSGHRSSHRGQAAIDRLAEQFPDAITVHTPVHASRLHQPSLVRGCSHPWPCGHHRGVPTAGRVTARQPAVCVGPSCRTSRRWSWAPQRCRRTHRGAAIWRTGP